MNAETKQQRVALIGLGLMGSGMARRLLGAGFPLTVYNRTLEKVHALAKDGAHVAGSPREAAEHADVVISMVADDPASREIWLGHSGALGSIVRDAIIIESSTLSVGWVRELAAAAAVLGCEMIDAPVTGTKPHAASGELNFLVGGSEIALEKARPVLSVMARSIVHVGPVGSGSLLKLVNNFMCGVQAASLAEAMALVEGSGLDVTKALSILTEGAPGSPLVKTLTARMTTRNYTPNFLLKLIAKDLNYAIEEGRLHAVPLTTAGAALDVFNKSVSSGDGDKDFAAVVEQFRGSRPR